VGADLRGVTSVSRFIVLSFAFLAWAFYEVSGGQDFQPRMSAAIAATEDTQQRHLKAQSQSLAKISSTRQTVDSQKETNLIVTRMIVADEISVGRGITSYSMTDAAIPNGRKLVFSLSTPDTSPQIRRIRANNVNMRTGPGTQFVVLDTLPADSRVKLLDDSVRGWVKLRSLDSGRVGWIQKRFISAYTS
jgi:hypothetical protein